MAGQGSRKAKAWRLGLYGGTAALLLAAAPARAQLNVLTERNDTGRTGANLLETQLNVTNVTPAGFGKLWSYPVSGSVQAEPLYVSSLTVNGAAHNVLFVATMNDQVYAFDADSKSPKPLWHVKFPTQLTAPVIRPVPIKTITGNNFLNIVGNVGITSTPVIDLAGHTMYLVARTLEGSNFVQRLHALDITTGAEKFGGPVVITASVKGNGAGSSNGVLAFNPQIQNQRVSLALANGQVLIGWGSHEDFWNYHGWFMAYDMTSLQQKSVYCVTPNGAMGAIWMAGHAPVIDSAGNAYVMTGNGSWDGSSNFGESFLKFSTSGALALSDWFTPDNYQDLNNRDADLGSSGPMLIPGTDLLVGAGKDGLFYVMHTGKLGHMVNGNGQIVQVLDHHGREVKGGAVFWNRGSAGSSALYVWTDNTTARAYRFNGSGFDPIAISQSLVTSANGASNGVLSLSANGGAAGSGILWSSMPISDNADHGVHRGVLRALNAQDLTKELWNSEMNSSRDSAGYWPKFSPPLVANGRVYLASFPTNGVGQTVINVYGLLPGAAAH